MPPIRGEGTELRMSWAGRLKHLGLALATTLAGCALPGSGPWGESGGRGQAAAHAFVLPETAPVSTALDLGGLPPAPVNSPAATRPDRALSERECVELAARNSALANMLEARARACCTTAIVPPGHDDAQAAPASPGAMQAEILTVAALEARNASAGTALSLYYQLARVQAQRPLAEESLGVIDRALKEAALLESKGVKVPATFESLSHQALTLRDQTAEIDRGAAELSAELRQRLNLGPDDEEWLIRALLAAKVDPNGPDPAAAIRDGLARRPEANLLRRLDRQQSPETLRMLRTMLGAAQPLLASSCQPEVPSRWEILCAAMSAGHKGQELDSTEMASIRAAWDVYRLDREREIVKELRVAANDVRYRLEQVAIARDQVHARAQRLEQLRAESERGIANYGDRVEAELKALEAKSVLWEKVFAWYAAVAKLRQAQFTLLP